MGGEKAVVRERGEIGEKEDGEGCGMRVKSVGWARRREIK